MTFASVSGVWWAIDALAVESSGLTQQIISGVLSLVVSLGGAGLLVRFLTLRQDRRKIAGDASVAEANAGVALSGAALKMIESEQQQRREADARAAGYEASLQEARNENSRVWAELTANQWKSLFLERRETQLEQFIIDHNLEPPPRDPEHDPGHRPPLRPRLTDGLDGGLEGAV